MLDTQNKVLWHVVLISFRPDTPESVKREVYERYQTLDQECGGKKAGILFWRVDWNLDLRKNIHLVEIALFSSNEALQTFRKHPKHTEIANILRDVADWQVGDIHSSVTMVIGR